MTPLIVIDPAARKRFTRAVAALEDAAADGNTWGPDTDARILANTLLDGARLNKRDLNLIIDCLHDYLDDTRNRLHDFPQDYDDHVYVQRRLAAVERVLGRLTKENAPRHDDLEEDPDAPDDGKVLVAGVLYDRETGMEADPQ